MTESDLVKIIRDAECGVLPTAPFYPVTRAAFDALVGEIRDQMKEIRKWELAATGLRMCTCGDLHCRHEEMCFD